ncbi:ATP-dependent zinc metalloprotease FTSH 12, chloroplastic isoform X1 [Cryptomeria japonica]|uniref:ATP-dependent zinc metalloprotease FTSH 12, chloroplastic isoform X1 n=1 Tax=Cryptomeria japonica TaxID=3369 RepID=UPI0025AB85C9|nr:ATP-dependent zinc metalloprotease FTSH 12, chloroplastic isoform X1 [Cryptomeria japonica]XP_057835824.1 ATP-dependent zinc metalloprotease FTSH 12, chloroplastic isoform X1 [Cryptomeria japonica]XP_057835825.1 ATP-dependent zinc metalloprotease FTSH 12, chloroplastic isoform X1 [Cryptomeria japonica]
MECSPLTFHGRVVRLQLTSQAASSQHSHFPNKQKNKPGLKYKPRLKYNSRQSIFIIIRAQNGEGSDNAADKEEGSNNINEKPSDFKWSRVGQAFGRGTQRFYQNFQRGLKKETGVDIEVVNSKVGEVAREVQAAAEPLRRQIISSAEKLRFQLWPHFVAWNRLELWKDLKQWEIKRISAFILYVSVFSISVGGLYLSFRRARSDYQMSKLAESYLEAVIPDPSCTNVRKLKQRLWRRYMPEGLKVNKYHLEDDGPYRQSRDYVGQDVWENDTELPHSDLEKGIDDVTNFNDENKNPLKELGLKASRASRTVTTKGAWLERLGNWDRILEKEKVDEDTDKLSSKFAISFDWQEMKENFELQQKQRLPNSQRYRGEWISKRWWQYRPKLPYTYFLLKVECLEVEAVVFAENFKRIYVTMKEGFPSEYIVDIPVDPYLPELLARCGVEVDTVYSRNRLPSVVRAFAVMAPVALLVWCMNSLVRALFQTSRETLYRTILSTDESLLSPAGGGDTSMSGYKDIVLGGNVWDVLDEILMYMKNPTKYLKKGVRIPRAVLISGPPGTGKTLFARAIARDSGKSFVFASGSQFTSTDKGSSMGINNLFAVARAHAPAFVFIDEIDALAGKNAIEDAVRRVSFDALLEELDEENPSMNRNYLREGVVLLCATNRPDELDNEFMKRIERQIYIGLPAEEERVKIFSVHTSNKRLAEDVNFQKLVFRTPGFSGADIQNLVNESAIMAIRKGHKEIFQQDIIDALDKRLFENMGLLVTEEEQEMYARKVPVENKRLLAVHEAGHMLLAHLFPRFDLHGITFLLPGGKESTLSVFYPREDMMQQGYATLGYYKMHMVVAHGGRCAEQIIFGDDNVTDEGQDDLLKISRIARELVISPANPRLGLLIMTWKDKFEVPNRFPTMDLIKNKWDDPNRLLAAMSVEVSELFTREMTRYIDEAEEEAMTALRNNRHILDRLVAELLEHSKLTGLEVEEIVKSMNPVMIADPTKMPEWNLDTMDTSPPANRLRRFQDLDIWQAPLHRC